MSNYQDSYHAFLIRFVNWYKDCRLALLATGGGTSLGQLAAIPGASKVLHSFYSPYETRESVEFIRRFNPCATPENYAKKAVSAESAEALFMAMWTKNKTDGHVEIHNVAITAACTSMRWRRGENQAFVAFQNPKTFGDEIWHLKLDKLTEESHRSLTPGMLAIQRLHEDQLISMMALHLATGFTDHVLVQPTPTTFCYCGINGTVSRVNP